MRDGEYEREHYWESDTAKAWLKERAAKGPGYWEEQETHGPGR